LSCGSAAPDAAVEQIQPEPTAKDIVVSDLNDPCDCVDAMLMTVNELNDLDLENDSLLVEFEFLIDLEGQIETQCIETLQFSKTICDDCENFEKLEAAFDSIKPILKF
jgi:hypothetical protein